MEAACLFSCFRLRMARISFIRFVCSYFLIVFTLGTRATELPDFTRVVDSSSSAVVKIIVDFSEDVRDQSSKDMPDYLRRFFEHRGERPPQIPQRNSMGSGFILTEDGYIVTNNHVVEGATEVIVRLSDRREFQAKIIGLDPRSDLALIKIDEGDLSWLKLSDDDLKVGEWVLAIGSPFGLDYSVAAGIVSAKGRSLPTERNENYVPFVQTDVAINPGNSGGPLLNLRGEVAGVNSQIFTRSGGSIGLSFAIPSSVVKNVVSQLKKEGKVTRGWLGVTIQDVDKNLAESFGLERPRGALISQLAAEGPAEKAGLRAGDIVLKLDGKEIQTSSDLPHVVGLIAPETKVDVELIREGRELVLVLQVGGLAADEELSLLSKGLDKYDSLLGLKVENSKEIDRDRYGIIGGVTVLEVDPRSISAEAGIIPGDVITLVGSAPISGTASFKEAVKRLQPGRSVPIRLIRRDSHMFIGIKIPE